MAGHSMSLSLAAPPIGEGAPAGPTTTDFSPASDGRMTITLADPLAIGGPADFSQVGSSTYATSAATAFVSGVFNVPDWTGGVYFLKFTGLPDFATITAATLHLCVTGAALPSDIEIVAQLLPIPADEPTAGDNPYDTGAFTFTADDEFAAVDFDVGVMNDIDILPTVITQWLADGRGEDGVLVLRVGPDQVNDMSVAIATLENTDEAKRPYLTLTYT